MEIYTETYTVSEEGLRTSALFRLLQEISGHQSALVGRGQKDLAEKGLMWVVIRQIVELQRWPQPGERLLARTWPGVTRHSMCPRYYRLETEAGELLLTGCAIWAVVDRETRKMILPSAYGVEIEPLVTGLESRRPPAPARGENTESGCFTVPEEVLDENGHMNNTRYYDLAEGFLGTPGRPLRAAVTEYISEARLGDTLTLHWGGNGSHFTVEGSCGGPCFRMELQYE